MRDMRQRGQKVMSAIRNLAGQHPSLKLPALLLVVILSGCFFYSFSPSQPAGDFIGHPIQDFLKSKGMPQRQTTAPSGATVYVYDAYNWAGQYSPASCHTEIFIRDGKVVGYSRHGFTWNCSGTAGETY
jgi:hypothetical protein